MALVVVLALRALVMSSDSGVLGSAAAYGEMLAVKAGSVVGGDGIGSLAWEVRGCRLLVVDLAASAGLVACYFAEARVFAVFFHLAEERVLKTLDSADVVVEVAASSLEGP